MSLLEEFKREFKVMSKTQVSDGEGGFNTVWVESDAVIILYPQHNTTIAAQVAEKDGAASTYTFLHNQSFKLDFHDVVKDVETGEYYRITSPSLEETTPGSSNLNLTKVIAEKWELPI